jgi:hypothetical protein
MVLAFILVAVSIVASVIGVIHEKHKTRNARRNGNGYDKLERFAKDCRCKGID